MYRFLASFSGDVPPDNVFRASRGDECTRDGEQNKRRKR
jgi:hypothetical protein